MVTMTPGYDTSWSAYGPSTTPRLGASVAVSAMSNSQLNVFLFQESPSAPSATA
jgi:hypothetical protein